MGTSVIHNLIIQLKQDTCKKIRYNQTGLMFPLNYDKQNYPLNVNWNYQWKTLEVPSFINEALKNLLSE